MKAKGWALENLNSLRGSMTPQLGDVGKSFNLSKYHFPPL